MNYGVQKAKQDLIDAIEAMVSDEKLREILELRWESYAARMFQCGQKQGRLQAHRELTQLYIRHANSVLSTHTALSITYKEDEQQ